MEETCSIRRKTLQRRERFAAEHQFVFWMRCAYLSISMGPKSPLIGYAAAKNQSMLWPKQALITGWFPHLLVENAHAMTTEELRGELVSM